MAEIEPTEPVQPAPPAVEVKSQAPRLPRSSVFAGMLLYAFTAVTGFGYGVCAARGVEVPGTVHLVPYLGFPVLLCLWLQGDIKRGREWCVWDLGLFLFLAWPVLVPFYLLRTRGARGLLPILGVAVVYIAVFFFAFVLLKL